MNNLKIDRTRKSPYVELDYNKSTAVFEGRSIHSDGFEFYTPVIKWLSQFDGSALKVDFKFDHINTITNKCILQILLDFKKKNDAGKIITVSWHYDKEDDDMFETGEELEILCGVKMEYIIIEE